MKSLIKFGLFGISLGMLLACGSPQQEGAASTEESVGAGQSAVQDPDSKPTVVQVAIGSADHTTLVTAVKTAELVDALSNVGPFTVFAPTNAAFEALPAGTVENLLKPEQKQALTDILQYHVYVGVIRPNLFKDGMQLNQVSGGNVTLGKAGDQLTVNGANIVGSVEAANGIVYVIDKVLLPQ
jgi:uncharacterized surface protein with fasciclin (FAS1) repeats